MPPSTKPDRIAAYRGEFIVDEEGGAVGVTCPALPGVFGVGKTLAEAEADFAASLETLIEYLDEIGEPVTSKQGYGSQARNLQSSWLAALPSMHRLG